MGTPARSSRNPSVELCETFVSIQGESTHAGLPCFFIRLAGCNLRCGYCDTPQALEGPGVLRDIAELAAECDACGAPLVEITGGEPLLQPHFCDLAEALTSLPGRTVLVETNGSIDISVIPPTAVAIMDIKCPGSGSNGSFDVANIRRLRPHDEVKFVLTDRDDYEWAREVVAAHSLDSRCRAVLFAPSHGRLCPADLARWIVTDRLYVRINLQLHKILSIP